MSELRSSCWRIKMKRCQLCIKLDNLLKTRVQSLDSSRVGRRPSSKVSQSLGILLPPGRGMLSAPKSSLAK